MDAPTPFSEINPYAAPLADAAPDWSAAAGVGCWRHGSLLVVHEEAQLPPICVKTGKPAAGYRLTRVRWSHPLRWPREYVALHVPLCARMHYLFGRGRLLILWAAILVGIVGAVILTAIFMVVGLPAIANAALVIGLVVAVGLGLLCCWAALGQPVWFVRRRRKYYWLSGVNRRFLEQLPTWMH